VVLVDDEESATEIPREFSVRDRNPIVVCAAGFERKHEG